MRRHDTVEVEVHSTTASIVTLRGEHDLDSATRIASALKAASVRRNVVVDLSQCTFLDSSVISALLRASNTLHVHGGQILLVIPPGRHRAVRCVFEIMSVERLMPMFETRAAAFSHVEAALPASSAPTTMRLRALSEIIDQSLVETDDHRRAA
ncbi:MAG: STAS domain-containing protein [Actinomycetota bacterium]|nr:STAS domain-containing protein [Actinomycetota bacterium]